MRGLWSRLVTEVGVGLVATMLAAGLAVVPDAAPAGATPTTVTFSFTAAAQQ
jgi:hypothetical protein